MQEKSKAFQTAIVLHGCDRYLFLYKGFEIFFRKHWPVSHFDLSYFAVTERADYQSDLFANIKSGTGEWADRLLSALEQVPQSRIIYFQEDFWLNRDFDRSLLEALLSLDSIGKAPLTSLKLHHGYRSAEKVGEVGNRAIHRLDKENSEYLMSHQVTLWDKGFLKQSLNAGESAWENEILGTERLRRQRANLYQVELADNFYAQVSLKGRFNQNVQQFVEQLDVGDSYRKELEARFEGGIPHGQIGQTHTSAIRIMSLRNRFRVRVLKVLRWLRRLPGFLLER